MPGAPRRHRPRLADRRRWPSSTSGRRRRRSPQAARVTAATPRTDRASDRPRRRGAAVGPTIRLAPPLGWSDLLVGWCHCSSLSCGCCGGDGSSGRHSLRRASMGASLAARLGRVDPEGHADADGHDDGADRGHRRDGDRVGDEMGQDPRRRAGRGRHPSIPPTSPEHRGLDQELAADGPGRGPERLAQTDLTDPLGHRHQHDVHDADPADQQRDAGDAPEQDGERLVDRGGGADQRGLRRDGEVGIRRRR